MTIWYRTSAWGDEITEIEVVKETEKTIVVKRDYLGRKVESRTAKHSAYESHFPTREEAIKHLEERYSRDVQNAEEALTRARAKYSQFRAKYNL